MRKILIIISVLAVAGCVSTKKYDAMRAQALKAERQLELANQRLVSIEAEHAALQNELSTLTAEQAALAQKHAELRDSYDKMLGNASTEAARLLKQLEQNQRDLDQNARELDERSRRMQELEESLRARDAALDRIKSIVTDALLGFEGKGLSITRREGKVYVSMEDKLLFKSGSFDIDPNGAQAVRDLAEVLAANPDIEIMVEGHTDNVPYRVQGNLRDNLDLSAKRATTVTRLLLENKGIAPARITSAGRGEWLPISSSNSAEARQLNRRTEIILSPKLDELLKITQ